MASSWGEVDLEVDRWWVTGQVDAGRLYQEAAAEGGDLMVTLESYSRAKLNLPDFHLVRDGSIGRMCACVCAHTHALTEGLVGYGETNNREFVHTILVSLVVASFAQIPCCTSPRSLPNHLKSACMWAQIHPYTHPPDGDIAYRPDLMSRIGR